MDDQASNDPTPNAPTCWLCGQGEAAGELIPHDSGLLHPACLEIVETTIQAMLPNPHNPKDPNT
jgi:hypothetical protein